MSSWNNNGPPVMWVEYQTPLLPTGSLPCFLPTLRQLSPFLISPANEYHFILPQNLPLDKATGYSEEITRVRGPGLESGYFTSSMVLSCLNSPCISFLLFKIKVRIIIIVVVVAIIKCNSLMQNPLHILSFIVSFQPRGYITEFMILFSKFMYNRSLPLQSSLMCTFPREEHVPLPLPKKRWDSDHISSSPVPGHHLQIWLTAIWQVLF